VTAATITNYDPLDPSVPIHIDMEASIFGKLTRQLNNATFAVDIVTRAHRKDLEEIWSRVLPVPSQAVIIEPGDLVHTIEPEPESEPEPEPEMFEQVPEWATGTDATWVRIGWPLENPRTVRVTSVGIDTSFGNTQGDIPAISSTGPMPIVSMTLGPKAEETAFIPPSRINFVRNWWARRRWNREHPSNFATAK